ncbi:MAG: hypothetical protein U0360_03870 [Dehalococcoidia bacterium]
MIRIELSGDYGAVYPLVISRGVELSNDRAAGDDVLNVHDVGGHVIARLLWKSVLSAAVEDVEGVRRELTLEQAS